METKEPWMMTREEFANIKLPPYEYFRSIGWPEGYEYNKSIGYRTGTGHRVLVRIALSEGKPVPPEVLKDYPELAKVGIKPLPGQAAMPEAFAPLAEEARQYKTFEDFETALFSKEWHDKWQHKEGLLGDIAVMGLPKATKSATEGRNIISGREGIRDFWQSAQAQAAMPEAAKEPWMMTRYEFRKDMATNPERYKGLKAGLVEASRTMALQQPSWTEDIRRQIIRQSLSEGKLVPFEILKDISI